MENYKVVRPSHLNHYGYLFGGELLKWVDEISWIAATHDYPGCKFVTVSMDRVVFKRSVRQGTVLRFDVQRYKEGERSVQYEVDVFCDDLDTGDEQSVFSTHVTFVCLDGEGNKTQLPGQGDTGYPPGTPRVRAGPKARNRDRLAIVP